MQKKRLFTHIENATTGEDSSPKRLFEKVNPEGSGLEETVAGRRAFTQITPEEKEKFNLAQSIDDVLPSINVSEKKRMFTHIEPEQNMESELHKLEIRGIWKQ